MPPYTRGIYPDMYRGRPWTIRQYAGFASAEESNARYRYLLEQGQTGLSVAFDLPTQLGLDSDDPRAEGEVGRTGVAIDSLADMELLLDGIPLDRVSTSMTINAPAALLLLLYELVAERQGVDPARAPRDGAERHPQGVRRPRQLHLPAAAVDAAHHRPLRLLRRSHPGLEHDLDLRVPHPGGGLDRRAGARVHARERDRLLPGGRGGGARSRRLRRAAVVLLQRPQRLPAGGGEVPGGAAALGRDHGEPVRSHEPEGARAPVPRADRRLDADGAAARGERRAGRDPGAVGGARRLPVAPHERLRRGARAPVGACSDARAPDPAGDRARVWGRLDRRPARRLLLRRGADTRARGARARAHRRDRRARRGGRGDRGRLGPGRDRGGRLRVDDCGRDGQPGRSSGSTHSSTRPAASASSCTGSIRSRSAGRSSARLPSALRATARRRRPRSRPSVAPPEAPRTCSHRFERPLPRTARSARCAACSARSGAATGDHRLSDLADAGQVLPPRPSGRGDARPGRGRRQPPVLPRRRRRHAPSKRGELLAARPVGLLRRRRRHARAEVPGR